MDQTPYQLHRKSWGLNDAEPSVYMYITLQLLISVVELFSDVK